MSFYQQNRDSYRGRPKRNSNSFSEGQTGAKRRPRWPRSKVGNDDVARDRRDFDIDAPLFKAPYPLDRSPSSRSQNYNDDEIDYHYDQRFDHDVGYNGSSYSQQGQRNMASPARGGQRRKPLPQLKGGRFLEPQHTGPAWQWEKYFHECQNWQDKHKLAYYKSRCMALEFENQMLFDQIKSLIHENSVFAEERGVLPTMLLENFPGGLHGFKESDIIAASSKNKGKNRKTSDDTSADESLVCDVPDTMIAVIEKSMRHKLNLYKERKMQATKEKTDENEKKKDEELKKQGPKEPRGLKHKEEMEKLYGEKASLIQGLETSVQHSFNRNCDTHKPEMWLAVPLNPEAVV